MFNKTQFLKKLSVREDDVLGCCAVSGLASFCHDSRINQLFKRDFEPFYKRASEVVNSNVKRAEKRGQSLVVAIINTNQTHWEEVFTRCGFEGSGWIVRPKHSPYYNMSKIQVFTKRTNEEE